MVRWFRSLFERSPRRSAPRSRLEVELLESRWTPAAPGIVNFSATQIGSYLAVEGRVTDESPGTTTVTLGGAVAATLTPDASGYFSSVTSWSGGSQVTANATDVETLSSGQQTATIANPSNANPFVTFSVFYGQQRQVTISGRVYDESPAGRTVTLGGMVSGTAITDSVGNFSKTLTATGLGQVTATTVDPASNQSNQPLRTLASAAPQIEQFQCVELMNGWFEFSGKVIDESPGGLTVRFGGAPDSLENKTVTVQADGWFYYRIQLNGTQSDEGTATAVVTDWWTLTSPVAQCDVHQSGV